jgi:peptide deformylase
MENNNSHSNGANNSDPELDRFRQIINNKINEKKNQIFPLHSMAYNNNVQYEINCLEWVLGKTNQRQRIQMQMQISQVEDIIQKEINYLNGKMTTKSINKEKRDMFIIYTETLSWVLYVIHSIKEKGLHWKLTI